MTESNVQDLMFRKLRDRLRTEERKKLQEDVDKLTGAVFWEMKEGEKVPGLVKKVEGLIKKVDRLNIDIYGVRDEGDDNKGLRDEGDANKGLGARVKTLEGRASSAPPSGGNPT